MSRVNATEKTRRHDYALQLLSSGRSFTSVMSETATLWGVTRDTSRRYARAAMAEFQRDCEQVATAELLAETIHRLQGVAHRAAEAQQYAAAVGAIRLLSDLVGLGAIKGPGRFP